MSDEDRSAPGNDLAGWYADVASTLREKPPATVAHELPGLVDAVTDAADDSLDYLVVGVSFSKQLACFDYAVEAVRRGDDDEPVTETLKPPASERHRYVRFTQSPDPHFDASALRARLLATVERLRREEAESDDVRSSMADLWEDL